jgi:hypothetical protein
MPRFLAEFAPGASKHPLGSCSFSWSPLPLLGSQIGRAALPRYFSLGKMVAIVGKPTKHMAKTRRGVAFSSKGRTGAITGLLSSPRLSKFETVNG